MKVKEMKARVVGAVDQGINEFFLKPEQCNGELKLGGVISAGPSKLKLRVVDKDFRPHTYLITIEETAQ